MTGRTSRPRLAQQKNALPHEFYRRSTVSVARDLLGKKLCRRLKTGEIISGWIVETEAYLGVKDKGCHSFGGRRTERTSVMYEAGGMAYIYLIYGMYHCLNVVSAREGAPEAVLIRALEPADHIELMQMKSREFNPHKLLNGPGKLCKVFEIDKSLNRHDLMKSPLWIEDGIAIPARKIHKSARINIHYAEDWVERPLRFTVKDSAFVSVKIKA